MTRAESTSNTARWSSSNLMAISSAIDEDKGFEANVGIRCPVCECDSLDYERFSLMDVVAWCRTCQTGYRQGRGAELAQSKTRP